MSDLIAARRAWEAFTSISTPEELDTLFEGWDPEVEYVEDPKWPGSSTFRGYEAVARRFREYVDVLGTEGEFVLEDVREVPGGFVSLAGPGCHRQRRAVRPPLGLPLPAARRQGRMVPSPPRSRRGPRRGCELASFRCSRTSTSARSR